MTTTETRNLDLNRHLLPIETNPNSINNNQSQSMTVKTEVFSGPLPPPEAFEGYEKILPGAADRILSLAERQVKHRQEHQLKILSQQEQVIKQQGDKLYHESVLAYVGMAFAFLLALFGLGGSIYCAIKGYQIASAALGAAGVATIITPFLKQLKSNSDKELQNN